MNTYLLLFVLAACSSLLLTPLVRRTCERFRWLDAPRDGRHSHLTPVPRLGGVAIFGSLLIALAVLPFINNLLTASLRANRSQLLTILVPASLVFLFGVYDDFRGTNARFKFVGQALAGIVFYLMGGRIENLSIPLVGTVVLPQVLGCALTVLWTVAITNAFNLIDGIDGLATGAALFSLVVLLGVSVMLGHPLVTVFAVALCGALIGFLPYNFNPASIFMGDSGSLFIGFILAALSVLGTQKASTAVAVAIPIIAFGLPVLDTGFALVRRFVGRRPVFQGDREHIHHKLLERGWSERHVALVLYGICALFGLLAMLFVSEGSAKTTGLVLFVIAVAVVLFVGSLRYHEVDELKAGMRRNFNERRLRVANHIGVRRASRAMSKATTLGEIFNATRALLEPGEFVYATVQLGRGGDAERNEAIFEREKDSRHLDGCSLRGGLICWAWERGDVEAEKIVGSGYCWTLRLPLSTENAGWGYINLYRELEDSALLLDINYLCELFRREMALAAERVLTVVGQEETATKLMTASSMGD
jgi:UDP-GlcNAc:undecaprenyl-phosphate/decaprenyl-phosphate GlcNAc-1-phosphate transferase